MGKVRKNLSEFANTKKRTKSVTDNPFEIHINRQKHQVLGRKSKNDFGLPGVSKAKSLRKRKGTLLQEYKHQNKSNKFVDKRIGEKNNDLSENDKYMARFTAERVKAFKKQSIFNLADDEVLTHKGQTLSEIEKFEMANSDDESEDETGRLESKFVGEAHFGGGLLTKTGKEGALSHKDLIDQLIAESKKRKAERQKTKEDTLDLTEKLDTEWKDLLPIISRSKKEEQVRPNQVDDYDKLMAQLKFEARGFPSDRLKTEDEIAKEEKEKLEKLERDRLNRMRGVYEESNKKSFKSADDLDDDFAIESDLEPEETTLAYDVEGKANNIVTGEIVKSNENNSGSDKDAVSSEEESESENESSGSEEESDNLLDLKENESESNSESETENDRQGSLETFNFQENKIIGKSPSQAKDDKAKEEIRSNLLVRKEIMEKARKELPFTFAIPENYEDFEEILAKYELHEQNIVIERMIKCTHPSLGENNKEKLATLFKYLLQYINDLFSNKELTSLSRSFQIFYSLIAHLYELTHLNKEASFYAILSVLEEKHEVFKNNPKCYPGLEVLAFMEIVGYLFPTSDFRHQIITPTLVFISQILTKARVRSRQNVTYGLFLVTLALKFTTLSKRFLPAAINFLSGILHAAIPKKGVTILRVLPPFKPYSNLLVVYENSKKLEFEPTMYVKDFLHGETDNNFKIRALYVCARLACDMFLNLQHLPAVTTIFEPILSYLLKIPESFYPENLLNMLNSTKNTLQSHKETQQLEYIVAEKKRPKALRLYEPNIEKIFDYKRHKNTSKEKAEREKLLHKYKKEFKGAIREIRRDRAFIGRFKIQQKIQSDKERQDKVKRIFADAACQQHELNSLDRKRKRK